MFRERTLPSELDGVRGEHAPNALVLDCDSDFETLAPAVRDELALLTESLVPYSSPDEWLPEDVPELLRRFAGSDLVVGMPGDGSIVWSRQTSPPVVLVKARVQGSPESFVDFLIGEALVELSTDVSEQFLGFFGEHYRQLDAALPFDSGRTYQVANALYEGYLGLHTRDVFREWEGHYPDLYDTWVDAGERITSRVENVTDEVAAGRTEFEDATELACSAIKHGVSLPAPFDPLDTLAYRDHGAPYAVKWAEKVFADD